MRHIQENKGYALKAGALSRRSIVFVHRQRVLLLLVLLFVLLASRRWSQLASPQVWDEEGAMIGGFLEHGWNDLLRPLNGYLLLVPKLIVGVSLAVSLSHYPAVATGLAWAVILAVGLAVALSPTHLRARAACAVAVFAVPTDPEVFGLALYTFWWASILVLLLAVWDERRPAVALRLAYLAAGGLSSPVIVAVLPVLYFRAWRFRERRAEVGIALAATAVCAVQLHFVALGHAGHLPPPGSVLRNVVPKLLGGFAVGDLVSSAAVMWLSGTVLSVAVAAWCFRDRRNPAAWTLLFLLAGAVALSVSRVDPGIINQRFAGPRYFFFPFVLESWILIQAASGPRLRLSGMLAVLLLGLAAVNAVPAWRRTHVDLHWAEHVRSAACFPDYAVPIEFDGNPLSTWSIREPGDIWMEALGGAHLIPTGDLESLPTYPFRVVADGDPGAEGPGPRAVVSRASRGPVGMELTLRLRRGDRVRFRSGGPGGRARMHVDGCEGAFIEDLPRTGGWVTLEFSNSRLPADFALTVDGDERGMGEWAPIKASY
jgi:hypothetical protein